MGLSDPLSNSYPNKAKNCHYRLWFFLLNGSSNTETVLDRTQQDGLEMVVFNPLYQLVVTGVTTNLAHSPRPSTILRGNKIHMSGLGTSHRQFEIKPKEKFHDQ